MMANIVNLLSKAFTAQNVQTVRTVKPKSDNPFANPFVSNNAANSNYTARNYAKNTPVKGGYFAGYYNNKPNIVGQRLFVEA